MRKQDRFGRFGGEEWLGILIGDNSDSVENLFKRLSQKLRDLNLSTISDTISITYSLGAAIVSEDDDSVETTIKRADTKLYEAKENGRDCFKL